MSAVTLETLRADFRWSLFNLNGYLHAIASQDAQACGTHLDDADWWAKLPSHHVDRYCGLAIQPIARRYIIARDFNVFDPQRADMMWKLQNGGAQ